MGREKNKNYRLDSIKLDQTYYTEEGYLVDHPVVTTCGVFEYAEPDGGTRRELRLPDEVFSSKSLASYEGKPIIITHEAGAIDKSNVQKEQIGTILSPGYRDGDNVRCKIVIHNTDALKKCGLRELSLGYGLNLDETPGTYQGQPYDAIQRDIEINHLALVGEARAGDAARLNIDHKEVCKNTLKGGLSKMALKAKKRRNDGELTPEELEQAIALFKAQQAATESGNADEGEEETNMDADEVVSAVKERKDRRDSEEEQMDADEVIAEQEQDIEALLSVIDELQAANDMNVADEDDTACDGADDTTAADEDDLTADEDDSQQNTDEDEEKPVNMDSVDKLVGKKLRDYLDVCRMADRLNLDGVENLSLTAAWKKVIKTVNPKLNLDGKSDAYVRAAYDIAKQSVASRKKVDDQRRRMMSGSRNDSAEDAEAKSSAVSAREKMISRMGGKK